MDEYKYFKAENIVLHKAFSMKNILQVAQN